MTTQALLIVDAQYDFIWGSLGAPERYKAIEPIKHLIARFDGPIVASGDCHPISHCSFIGFGGEFPPHCIQYTYGAGLVPAVAESAEHIFFKGLDPSQEAFSAFKGTDLHDYLWHDRGIRSLHVCGFCTDYCVYASVMDAIGREYATFLHLAACEGVDREASAAVVGNMVEAGARIL